MFVDKREEEKRGKFQFLWISVDYFSDVFSGRIREEYLSNIRIEK